MKLIPDGFSRGVGRTMLQAKKNSPHLFFAGGLVGSVASTFLACRATLKLEKELDDIRANLKEVRNKKTAPELSNENYTDADYSREMMSVYVSSTKKIVKLYGPAIIIGGASVAALTGAHVQLARRNAALTAAFGAMSQAFEQYRERVRQEIGEEKELDIHRGIVEKKIVGPDGKKLLTKVQEVPDASPYARYFGPDTTDNWQKQGELNRLFIDVQQKHANDKLRAYGHVFLNEVYDALGLSRTPIGALVGWVWNGEGDNFINFGLYEVRNEKSIISDWDTDIVLDFNVDGIIYDKI